MSQKGCCIIHIVFDVTLLLRIEYWRMRLKYLFSWKLEEGCISSKKGYPVSQHLKFSNLVDLVKCNSRYVVSRTWGLQIWPYFKLGLLLRCKFGLIQKTIESQLYLNIYIYNELTDIVEGLSNSHLPVMLILVDWAPQSSRLAWDLHIELENHGLYPLTLIL